ncbi:MAG: glutathione peroxidase [Flavobacteriales bacterium]
MITDIYDVEVCLNNGKSISMASYSGKKLLIVNTASECYFTPQYLELQALYEQFAPNNFEILAFPSNDFGAQEPKSDAQIADFCKSMFGITFPLFEKTHVIGENAHPLFNYLQQKQLNEVKDARAEWNFTKFLVDEQGQLIDVLPSAVSPLDEQISSWIMGRH